MTILNAGRYAMLADQLDRLAADHIIEDWAGISLVPLKDLAPKIPPRHRERITWLGDFPSRFQTYEAASDYAASLPASIPGLRLGRVYAAEKYPGKYFPGGVIDLMNAFAGMMALKEKEKLDLVFSDYPAGSMDLFGYYLFKGTGGKTFYFTQSRVGERVIMVDSLEMAKPVLDSLYHKYSSGGLSEAQRMTADTYLEEFMRKKAKPVYFRRAEKESGILRSVLNGWNKEKISWYQHARRKWASFRSGRIQSRVPFQDLNPADRIIFFPVQYAPEASVFVRSPLHRDQLSTIQQLAMSIPAGYTLYVKDHPLLKHERDDRYYRHLLEFPNVKLLRYSEDTHDVLRMARLTITLSSTAGLESLLYGVPVLLLGGADIAYQNFRGVLKLDHQGLEGAILRAMELEIAESDKRAMILAFLNAGAPGRFNDPRWDRSILEPENTENLYRFFRSRFEWLIGDLKHAPVKQGSLSAKSGS